MTITLDKDYYIIANPESAELTEPASTEVKIYIEDKTGWPALYVYAWGDKEIFGGWPGVKAETSETVGGVTYKVLTVEGNGETENLIFHNNEGTQYDAASITLDKNYFITAEPTKATVK